jgi:hypothetical protein
MQKTDKWSEQIASYRFFNNEHVTEEVLSQCAIDPGVKACEGFEEVLRIQDTTELNLEAQRKRIKDTEGLVEVGNGTDLGFFCHPPIVVNPRDGGLMGVADIRLLARKREKDEQGE